MNGRKFRLFAVSILAVTFSSGASADCAEFQSCSWNDDWVCNSQNVYSRIQQLLSGGAYSQYKAQFGKACVRHDTCYRHGHATYGMSREECDADLLNDMLATCDKDKPWYQDVGDYYNALSGTTCGTVAISTFIAVREKGDSSFKGANDPKKVCYYDAENENAHVYEIGANGTLGHAKGRYLWTKGWGVATSIKPRADSKGDALYILKPRNGAMHMHRPNVAAEVGSHKASSNWADDWSTMKTFMLEGRPHVFLLKWTNGDAKMFQVDADGTLGRNVYEGNWSKGWSMAEFYEISGQPYLMIVKGAPTQLSFPTGAYPPGNGTAKIYKVRWNVVSTGEGSCPPKGTSMQTSETLEKMLSNPCAYLRPNLDPVKDYDMAAEWSAARVYSTAQANGTKSHFLFRLKYSNGDMRINKMNADGTIGDQVENRDWSAGWSAAEVFENGGQTFLLLLKNGTGDTKIYKFKPDGSVGDLVHAYDRRKGWNVFTTYRVEGKLFGLFLKPYHGGHEPKVTISLGDLMP